MFAQRGQYGSSDPRTLKTIVSSLNKKYISHLSIKMINVSTDTLSIHGRFSAFKVYSVANVSKLQFDLAFSDVTIPHDIFFIASYDFNHFLFLTVLESSYEILLQFVAAYTLSKLLQLSYSYRQMYIEFLDELASFLLHAFMWDL